MPLPEVGDEDVLVRVKVCGICGSDVHGYDGSSGRRIPPLVMGHEAAGVVERTGRTVANVREGDRVTVDSTISCGTCDYCRRGAVNLCDRRMVLGVSCAEYRRHGAFAEYVSVPSRIVYPLPDVVPFAHAALVEPLSVAVHAVGRRRLQPEARIVVFGCGMIGLLIVQVLRARGCRDVTAVDIDPSRLALAKTRTLHFSRLDDNRDPGSGHLDAETGTPHSPARSSSEESTVPAFDAAFEAIGRPRTVAAAIGCVRKGGAVTLVGNVTPHVDLPLQDVVTREISLTGSCASSGEYPEAIELLAGGAVDVAPLITAVAPLEEGPAWFDRLYRREAGLMKIVLCPK